MKDAHNEQNKQKKDAAYKKSPWRFLFAAMAVYGGAKLLGALWAQIYDWWIRASFVFSPGEAASVGIIGGADGPTAIFVATPVGTRYLIPALLLAVGILGFWKLRRCRK